MCVCVCVCDFSNKSASMSKKVLLPSHYGLLSVD